MVQEDEEGRILVFSHDFEAGAEFDVISQLETSTTVRILQTVDEETVPEISQPDEYTGHVIRYNGDDPPLAPTTLLFVRAGSMSADDSATLGDEASMFSSQLNLLETTIE